MGGAIDAFLDSQAEAGRQAAERTSKARAARRTAKQLAREQDTAAWGELRIKIPQLAELISARKLWRRSSALDGYLFALYEWYEIDQTDTYETLYLRMRRTILGRVKYSVGFFGYSLGGTRFDRVHMFDKNRWAKRTLEHVEGHLERLRFR